ncbi:MAG: MFS transporter [Chloroflexi bacterium]|nr:MFS transporter [Chloroflexota bacterium]
MRAPSAPDRVYSRIVNAWCMYDWANSAFATTILAAVLPVYYSQVAGATLPSEARATAYWSAGVSLSLLIAAVVSPILGTISDVMRGKRRFLAIFTGIGIVGTGLLVLVSTGDWLLASILFIVGRLGFTAANVFYDALLPHVARPDDRDRVSTRGYALGYLGGGLLLAVNVVMIQVLPGTWGPRLSFLSVAIWWAVFSIPLFRHVPEPAAATVRLAPNESVISVSFRRLKDTLLDIHQYRELFKFLIAFLIYNDGIGTIISVSAIYGAELGFGSVELILALLLVQFVGIPFSLIFGRLPNRQETRRPVFLAFILFSLISLPIIGVLGARLAPGELVGSPLPPYAPVGDAVGQGVYPVNSSSLTAGDWQTRVVDSSVLRTDADVTYHVSTQPGAAYTVAFNGQEAQITYGAGPDYGIWSVELDGAPMLDQDTGRPLTIDAYSVTERFGVRRTLSASAPGIHELRLINSGKSSPNSDGARLALAQIEVLPPIRLSNLLLIIGAILALQTVGAAFALLMGPRIFTGLADTLDTKNSIILALVVYAVIAVWGFFLDSVIEFWFLAWMVAVVQGGSQALSRSLYASMSPAAKSGEFFGLYGVMEKFSAIIGPLLFAAAATLFDSSRPAILSLIALFLGGIYLLTRVNVSEGQRTAHAEDAALLSK